MTEKSLLSLREIAQELNLNYRTMIDTKNQFNKFLFGQSDGQNIKYSSECIDFFRLIFALREEGYTCEMIRRTLLKKMPMPEDEQLKEWVESYAAKYADRWMKMDNDGGGWTKMDEDGCGWMGMDEDGGREMNADADGEGWTDEDGDGGRWTKMDQDDSGSLHTFKSEIDSHLADIQEQIKALQASHGSDMSTLAAQVNASVTQIYKALHELQSQTQSIDERLRHLEGELNLEPGPKFEFSELDLEQLQVQLASEEARTSHADLDFVLASISDGRPNKEAIVQWVWAERERDPSVSYARLVEMLDREGVPTLSGREGWNRTSLRNLAAKGKE